MSKSTTPWREPALIRPLRVVLSLLALLMIGVGGITSVAHAADPNGAHPRRISQQVILEVLPGLRQPGSSAMPGSKALITVVATATPVHPGRMIQLERRTRHGWRVLDSLRQDKRGMAEFFVPQSRPARPSTLRAVAEPVARLATVRSAAVSSDPWGAPVFDEEFDGAALPTSWEHRVQFYNPWGGRACSKGSPQAVSVTGGALTLTSMPDPEVAVPCTTYDENGAATGQYPYRLNGHVSTQHSFDFLYGVAAARMRFQENPGAHGAFWLQPRGLLETGPTPWGAEVDVIEWFGHDTRSRMASTVHEPTPSGEKIQIGGPISSPDRFLATRSDSWWRNYHVFSVQWTPTEYIFRISGHEVWRTDQGVSHDPEFLILSMLSSDYELPQLGADQFQSQSTSVDWVRVWQS
jgi:Glycosyl hydrolases family 16